MANNLNIKVGVNLDKKGIQRAIDDLQKSKAKIDIVANVAGEQQIRNLSDGLESINKRSAATVTSLYLLHKAVRELEQAAKKMIETAVSLDAQLTDL